MNGTTLSEKASPKRTTKKPSIAFIGYGVMAKAIAVGMQRSSSQLFSQYTLCDTGKRALENADKDIKARCVLTPKWTDESVLKSDVVVLAVKPQGLAKVLKKLPPRKDQLLISVVAGWSIDKIRKHLPKASEGNLPRIIRTMPNTPLCVGKGCTLYAPCEHTTEDDMELVETMFNSCGITERILEPQLDAATGIAGSGPSYVALFMEALADGAVKQGLPRDLALRLAAHTVEGAARMCTEAGGGMHPAILKDRVCSPGGTSIHGVTELENHGVRKAIIAAVAGAAKRSRDLNNQ